MFHFTQNSLVGVALEKKKKKFCQRLIYNLAIPEAYSEPCQISKPISILAKRFILDVWQGSEYASDYVLWSETLKKQKFIYSKVMGL